MKTLNFENVNILHPKMSEQEVKLMTDMGVVGVFEMLLVQGLSSIYPQGLPMTKGKILARLQARVAISPVQNTQIDIEDAEFDLVKQVFAGEEAKFQASQYGVILQYVDALEGI